MADVLTTKMPTTSCGENITMTCCPNACPDLTKINIGREKLRMKLLRATSRPIGFEDADKNRVLRSVHDPQVMQECTKRLMTMLIHIGKDEQTARIIAERLIECVSNSTDYEEIDSVGAEWHHKFSELEISQHIEGLMMDRNRWVAGLIAPNVLAGSVLDHDSGDSYVARFIQEQRPDVQVHTQDSFDFRGEVADLPIAFYDYEAKKLPYIENTKFDNVVLATVLHHCDEPEKMFDEVVRFLKPGGRLFLFENVFEKGDKVESRHSS